VETGSTAGMSPTWRSLVMLTLLQNLDGQDGLFRQGW
jgi:hypothetical protein